MRLGKVRFESEYLAIRYFYENKGWSIRWMCQQLGITRAAYYKWLRREIPEAEQENILLAQLVREYDDRFNHILGYRRMTLYINHLSSKSYSKNRVHRIMKVLNIRSIIRRKRKKYQHSNPEATAENILNRDFSAKAPNEKWATDVTEFKWYEGSEASSTPVKCFKTCSKSRICVNLCLELGAVLTTAQPRTSGVL